MSREAKAELIEAVIASFRANSSHEAAFDAVAAQRLGLSLTDLRCLDVIEGRGGVTAGELATASGLTTGAVTAVADRLERAGYARRVRDEHDRRKVNIEVTDLHYERSREIWGPLMADWQKQIGGAFSTEDLATVIRFLDATAALAERHTARVRDLV